MNEKFVDNMFYLTKKEYIKVIEYYVCFHIKRIEKKYEEFIKLEEKVNKNRSDYPGRYFDELPHGKLWNKRKDSIDEISELIEEIIWLEKCNLNNINFDKKSKKIGYFSCYAGFNDDIILKIVE